LIFNGGGLAPASKDWISVMRVSRKIQDRQGPPTDNPARLLCVLEANLLKVHEPELIERLRAMLARLRAISEEQ
jgi:hypothetical protein